MMQRDDEPGFLSAASGSRCFLTFATGTGMLYAWREYTDWLGACRFSAATQVLPHVHGAVIGVKP